jgi:hypothetical protein
LLPEEAIISHLSSAKLVLFNFSVAISQSMPSKLFLNYAKEFS